MRLSGSGFRWGCVTYVSPDFSHGADQTIFHCDESRALKTVERIIRIETSHLGAAGSRCVIACQILNYQSIETWVVRVQTDPLMSIQDFTGVDVRAAKVVVKVCAKGVPAPRIEVVHQFPESLGRMHWHSLSWAIV